VDEKRSHPSDRRRIVRNGRRACDASSKTSATLVWELPDLTRCWILRHAGQIAVHVTRESEDLQLHVVATDEEAVTLAEEWRVEFAVSSSVCG